MVSLRFKIGYVSTRGQRLINKPSGVIVKLRKGVNQGTVRLYPVQIIDLSKNKKNF